MSLFSRQREKVFSHEQNKDQTSKENCVFESETLPLHEWMNDLGIRRIQNFMTKDKIFYKDLLRKKSSIKKPRFQGSENLSKTFLGF